MIFEFLGEVKNRGLARTNRYDVVIPLPTATNDTARVACLFCDAVSLPGMSVATQPQRFYGEVREMPYERMFESVTMSFYVDSTFDIKTAFEQWMNLIVDPKDRTLGYYNSYIRPVEIFVRNIDDSAPYKITLHEAYPKAINSIQLDTSSREVMKMTLTMQYKYWTSSTEAPESYADERESYDPPISQIIEITPE